MVGGAGNVVNPVVMGNQENASDVPVVSGQLGGRSVGEGHVAINIREESAGTEEQSFLQKHGMKLCLGGVVAATGASVGAAYAIAGKTGLYGLGGLGLTGGAFVTGCDGQGGNPSENENSNEEQHENNVTPSNPY